MRKGFKGFMNKVFKVVWSKSKECYVVVPEIAKNNSGKKKVLASVLAGLAVAGAMGGIAPQQAMAGADYNNSHVNIWANTHPGFNGENYNVGQNSIVVGYQNTTDNVAGNDGKVAIGAKNTSTNNATTAVGNRNTATGGAATAVGAGNNASGDASLAVGNVSNANARSAVAVGSYNNVNYTQGTWQTTPKQAGEYSTVIGNYSSATGTSASAMGVYTNAAGPGSVAAGYSDNALGQNSVAIGSENTSHVADTITIGQSNNAKTMGGISIGKNNLTDSTNNGANFGETRNENSQIAIGRDNTATHLDTIAIGRDTHATGSGATALGARADASGNNSIAIGQSGKTSDRVIASGVNAIAIGMQSQASGESAIAEGPGSRAGGKYGVALGRTTKANAEAATALGNAAEANIANGVALGSSSVTTTDKGVLGYNPSDLHTRKYTNLQGNVQTATTAAVSIGNGETLTRQLTGLAAGTADTDAVNVAQLKNVGVALTGNTGSSDFLTDGGKLNVRGEGRVSAAVADEGAKDSKLTLKFDDTGMVKAGKNVTVDEKTVNGRTTYTINAADAAAKYDFLTNAKANGGKLDGSATPTKVQSGQTVNYAAGKNLTVKQDIDQSAGEQTYTYSLNSDLGGITSITNKTGGPTLNFGDHNISITGGDLDLGDHNITHLHSGGDTVDNAANIGDVIRISKGNDLHVAPTAGTNNNVAEYTVDANKKVTLTYQDGNGKNVNGPKAVIDLSGLKTGDMSSFNVKSTATEGKVAPGSAGIQEIRDGKTVEMQAGKNMTIKQTNNNGNAAVEFSLNKNVDLTPDGSIKIGDTNITDNGLTINGGPSITKTGINAGDLNITNVKAGVNDNDAVNVSQLNKVRADERHIKPGEYAVDANGKVTMTYLDGNNKDVPNDKAIITGIAKQDLSNINNGGKTVIKNLAKESIDMENGKNTTASHRDVNGVKTFKVDVEGDLQDITSITNKTGDGKVVFGGNQTVNVAGDHNIAFNAKVGDITGLTNVTLDAPDFATRGRAATEEQLKIVNNGFNNTVGLTGNTGATDLQKLNQAGGLSFGVVGANNGQYIKTTAAGKNVAVDLSDAAKAKLNNTVEVRGKNAAKVTSVTENTNDGGVKTIYTVDVDNVTPTAASTEKVKAKADSSSSTDKNIAKVTPQAGDQYGDAGATYEVNVSRNDVKDAAREAITVNTTNTTNNPITVTPVQNDPNHNTTYTVTFDGNKAATQIPLTYKANGQNAQTVTLDKGLNFTNGRNTTASVDAEGVVKYDVNKDLVNINSISNTTNGPKMEFGPNSINITNGPINMGDQNITNLKSGGDVINNAANIGDVKTISKANDLHIAPTTSNRQGETTTSYAYDAASKSVTLKYNDGNGTTQAGTVAKIDLSGLADQIKDGYSFSTDAKGNVVGNHAVTPVANGKTVSYAAGKNLTVAQNIDNATGEHTYTYALSNDVDLTPNGSLKIGDTILNNGGLTITGGPSITKTGINANNTNIINVKAGVNDTDAVNVKQLKDARTVVTSNDNSVKINKTENGNQVTYDLHVAPGAAQSVWNVKSTGNTTADSETTAKTISDGKTVEMAAGKNLTVKQTSNNDGAKVEFDLANNIKIGNDGKDGKDGVDGTIGVNGKDGSSVVINGKDGSIGLNGKDGKDGLTMKGEKGADGITRIVYNDNNNNKHEVATLDDGLRFDANSGGEKKNKLGSKVTVKGTGAKADSEYDSSNIKTSITQGNDGNSEINIGLAKDLNNINTIKNGGNATFTIGGDNFAFNGGNVSLGGNNIVNLKSGVINNNDTDNTNAANIGDVKNISKANDIHIKDKTYTVNADKTVTLEYVDGNDKAINKTAKIDLSNLPTGGNTITYKSNNQNAQTVNLNKGLNFTNGSNTTASVSADGVVKYDLNNTVNLTPSGSLTIGDTVVNNGGLTINHGPSITKTGINAANLNITNVKAGVNDTDAVNVKQLKDARTVVTSKDNSVTVNKTENGNQVTYDLHVAPGAAQSVWNVKSTGNTTADSETTAKTISDGKTVEMAAGKNLTVKQTSNNDGAKVEFDLANDIKIGNDGKDGKDGVDGKIGVNGKDGSAVVINGKDGSIGLNGKDGKDGITIRGEKGQDGVNGVNGKDGITRIVYEDKNNNKHEVATTDDGMKYAGDDAQGTDKSKVIAKKLNQTMDIVGGADKSKLTDGNIGVNNVDGKLKVQLSKEVNLTPAGSLTIGGTVVNNDGLTITGGPSITKTGINAGNKTIVNVDAGVNDTDAVNVKQLKTAKTEVKAGNNVTVDTTYGNDGHAIYTVNANDVALGDAVLKYSANGTNTQSVKLSQGLNFVNGNYTSASVDANGKVKYDVTIGKVRDGVDGKPGVDGNDGIATVKTVVDTINNSGWKGDVTGNTVNNHAATIVKPGTTVNFGAGKNLTVEQIVDRVTGDQTYNYALSDDIKVGHDGKDGKPGVDGKIGVNGKDGSSVVINGKDGSIGLNGKDGKDGLTMKGEKGADGVTRIVYNDNNNNKHEVATLDDGLRFDANSGGEKKNKLGSKVTVKGTGTKADSEYDSSNIKTSITQGTDGNSEINIGLAKDLNNINTIKNGGPATFTIGGNEFKFDGGNVNVGGNNITNVRAGVNDTDAVNVKQLNSARTEVEEGDNVKVTSRTGANGQTIYKVSAKATNLGDAELNYRANGGAKQKVKLSEGLNFIDGNYTTASVDANGQVKYDVNLGNIKQGTDGKPGVNGKDGIATVKTVVDTINNSGWKANATGNVVGTSTATIVKPGSTVNYGAGKNLNVKQTVNGEEQTYEFALDKDLKELNSVQTNTIHLGSPTSHTTINYNAGNDRIEYTTKNGTKQVANLDDIWTIQANGQDVRPVGGKVNVVGGNHINVSTDAAGKMTISADGLGTMNGFNVKSTGNTTNDSDKTAKNITDGKTVEFSGGKNLTVKQTNTADGAKVEFALNNNLDLTPNGSVKIGDTVVNNDGLTIKNGPTITKNNVDMGGQQIHNVKSGGDVDSNGANIGDIKRISKANDTRIKDGNYEVSQNGTVEMTYVDGAGKQLVDEHGNPVKATISGIARQDLSNITNEGKKVITGLSSVVKGGNNVTVDTAVDKTTGQKTYTVNADLSGAKVNASVGADGSGVAKGLKNPVKVEKGTQYIAGDNMVVERKPVEGDDKIDNSITYGLAHDLTEINSISNGGATLRINANPGGNKYDRDANVTPALEVHGGNLSMTGNRIVNLAPGIDGTDGVNVNQLRDSLTTVKSTDGTVRVTDVSNDPNKHEYDLHVNPAVDPRVDQLNEEVGHVGAQSAALSALKPIQYDPMEPTQIMAGYGNYRGNSALALGVAHYKNESTMFHAGVSWAGGNGHMMANAGVTWKVGNRDSEAAVADRYRKGPISSTYAMQTEVASMKAQNAGLKGEVSDLKAENEQIKAQNAGLQSEVDQLKSQMAAMMAKLGM